jgi:hypothetical protein
MIFFSHFMLQYWAGVKAVTRQQCDYTITGLKVVFPVALATVCPLCASATTCGALWTTCRF